MRRGLLIAGTIGLGAGLAYLLAWPVPFEPARWSPPPAPALDGVYAVNSLLSAAQWFCRDPICDGPEDVAVGADGRIFGGTRDGRIFVTDPDGANARTLARTSGHPLGLQIDAEGNLIVADAHKGLLAVDTDSGSLRVLATEHGGVRFAFTDDVDVAGDGKIYFSDASSKFGQFQYYEDMLEHRPNGRLLEYDPASGRTRLLLDGLYFANGVAVAGDGSFVLVAETWKYRIQRYWLNGPSAGRAEVFVDNLPGFPDGVSTGSDGRFWVALFAPRSDVLDSVLPRPFLRKVIWRLPTWVRPGPAHHGFVLGLDADGNPTTTLQDTAASAYAPITSVQEHAGQLYLGSLEAQGFARMPSPRATQVH